MADLVASPRPALAGRPRDQGEDHGGGLLIAGLLLAGAGIALYEANKHKGTGPSGACGPLTGPAATLPTGLYQTFFAPGVATTWWVVGGTGTRYGVTTPAQLARCFGPSPHVISSGFSFGSADSTANDFIRTVGDITACTSCPPGAPGV